MAEAVVQIVIDNLSSLIQNKLESYFNFEDDLRKLSSKFTAIKATLEDAEEKQFTNKAIKDWLQKLKDAANMLDDILDECATEALELEDGRLNCGLPSKVQCFCLSSFHPKHVIFRSRISKRMKMIKERLDEVAEERRDYHLNDAVTDRRSVVIVRPQTTSITPQSHVYGREGEKNTIVDFLVGDASGFDDLSVYPILGVGGLGKTTLAQLIFNDERVVDHFEKRIWVCVSEDFSLKRMTKAIIESASNDTCEDMDLDPLQRKLQKILQAKRYLLVLDDVWDRDQENWQRLRDVLACGAKGTSILVTTRLREVSAIMGTVLPYELSMLSHKDCFELFKERAFGQNEAEQAQLMVIGEEIVNKCAGVPLAAIALGSLLRFKRDKREWLSVKESNLWSLQGENFVMVSLRLSYLDLPVKLKQCFAFCALFPKDEMISKQLLVELWMANGFISSNEAMAAQDICDAVWNELYWRSFFQDIEMDEFGKITRFKMHDLIHDLAQSVTQEVCCFTHDSDATTVPEGIRHLSIHRQELKEVELIPLQRVKSLKTYINLTDEDQQFPDHVLKYYSLRALHFEGLENIPTLIGGLKYLRYLNVSSGSFKALPESLCRLPNLQILNVSRCKNLQNLPNNIKYLKTLQHLHLRSCNSLSSLAPSIGELTSLQSLSVYIVVKGRGFHLAELGSLKLKGELHIKHLERVISVADAEVANMGGKHLSELLLSWDRIEESSLPSENSEQILEALQPHTYHLQTLGVGGYKGVHFPRWMASPSLLDLRYVLLVDCQECLNLPPLGKLPSLKKLQISNMNKVKYLDGGFVGDFTALEFLVLDKLPNLTRLSSEEGENMFLRLSELRISECPELTLPCLSSLKRLCVKGKCNQGLLCSIHHSSCSLESLSFSNNDELTRFPNGMLQDAASLKELVIHGLPKLEELPTEMINLSAVQELQIWGCHSLESLPDQVLQQLRSLKTLRIWENLKFNFSAGFQYLTCLSELDISECPQVEGLPKALQHMTSLQRLFFDCLPNLRSLPEWLGNLVLLESLSIMNCPMLTHLPTSIQSLHNLKSLQLFKCPKLEERCVKESGQDWPLIAHVQDIRIRKSVVDSLVLLAAKKFIRVLPSSFVNDKGV